MPDDQQARPDSSAQATIRLSQARETPLTTFKAAFGTALYLYARSADSVEARTIGQDYLAFRYDEHNLTFAVCDGVGQSFMGDLAARLLGDGLIGWLWEIDRPPDADRFAGDVAEALNALTAESGPQVDAFELPEGLPPILVQALNMQRRYGSESMFVAGRLALNEEDPWIALCWLGDSPVAAIDIDGQLVDLGPKGHTAERWNAASGVKGTVHTWVGSAERVARVAGYTDGLALEHVPTDADLARLMETWAADPPGDDASLFDVRLAPSPETTGQTEAPSPEDLKIPVFEADETRPIVLPEEARTPVRDVKPLESAAPESTVVEGWRPLTDEKEPPAAPPEPATPEGEPALPTTPPQTLPEAAELLSTLSTQALQAAPGQKVPPLEAQKQIQMWQQAALLGLTSAALAMLMVERLIKEQTDHEEQS